MTTATDYILAIATASHNERHRIAMMYADWLDEQAAKNLAASEKERDQGSLF